MAALFIVHAMLTAVFAAMAIASWFHVYSPNQDTEDVQIAISVTLLLMGATAITGLTAWVLL